MRHGPPVVRHVVVVHEPDARAARPAPERDGAADAVGHSLRREQGLHPPEEARRGSGAPAPRQARREADDAHARTRPTTSACRSKGRSRRRTTGTDALAQPRPPRIGPPGHASTGGPCYVDGPCRVRPCGAGYNRGHAPSRRSAGSCCWAGVVDRCAVARRWRSRRRAPRRQDPPPRPTFRAGVATVRVDVSVTGRKGAPVTDLTATDFVLEEDGVVQTIDTCQFVQLTGERPPTARSRSRFARPSTPRPKPRATTSGCSPCSSTTTTSTSCRTSRCRCAAGSRSSSRCSARTTSSPSRIR